LLKVFVVDIWIFIVFCEVSEITEWVLIVLISLIYIIRYVLAGTLYGSVGGPLPKWKSTALDGWLRLE
jgi:hypothetical protein